MKKRAGIQIQRKVFFIIAFCIMYLYFSETAYAETTDPIGDAKNGIVEIVSGFSDREGNFFKMKSGSGF